jgi:hypothetical protein
MGSERKNSGQSISGSAMGSCFQVSANRLDPLVQAYQAAPSGCRLCTVRLRQVGGVVYLDKQSVSLPDQLQLRVGVLASMSEDIGQAFLHNPVRG